MPHYLKHLIHATRYSAVLLYDAREAVLKFHKLLSFCNQLFGLFHYNVCFILVLILISMFLRLCIYELRIFHANQTTKSLRNQGRTKGEGWSTANKLKAHSNFYCWPSEGGSSVLVLW